MYPPCLHKPLRSTNRLCSRLRVEAIRGLTADLGFNSRVKSSEDSWFETKAIAIPESGIRLCVKPFRLQTGQAL